jgi:hypothetical protein
MINSIPILSTTDQNTYCLDHSLSCPVCGCDFLHQTHLNSWFRKEDSETAMHVSTDREQAKIDYVNTNNPSKYRDGILIGFICEECLTTLDLAIIQHKGSTLLEWHITSECLDD